MNDDGTVPMLGPDWQWSEVPEGSCNNGVDGTHEHMPLLAGTQIICGAGGAVKSGRRAARPPVRFTSRRCPWDDETSDLLEMQRERVWRNYWEMQDKCCVPVRNHTAQEDRTAATKARRSKHNSLKASL